MADCLLVAAGSTVSDEQDDIAVSQQGGLGQPGGDQDVVRGVRHLRLPLPDHFLLQPRENVQHHLSFVLRHLGGSDHGPEGHEDDAVLGGLHEGGEVLWERFGLGAAGHQSSQDGVGHHGPQTVPSEGGPVIDEQT